MNQPLSSKTRKLVEDDIRFAEEHDLISLPLIDAATAKELIEALDHCEETKFNG
jgi:hypothetical protein